MYVVIMTVSQIMASIHMAAFVRLLNAKKTITAVIECTP